MVFAAGVCLAGESAWAMERPLQKLVDCQVTGAELLPSEAGDPETLCAAIRAARPSGSASVVVEVRIKSPHMMVATQTLASGETLPEIHTARTDRPLGRRSVKMLADALAAQLKVAAK